MTKRLWIATACGVLTWSVNVRAQSGAPNPREALAAQYVNSETGVTLADAITRLLDDPAERDRLRQNAPGHLARFTPQAVAAVYLETMTKARR